MTHVNLTQLQKSKIARMISELDSIDDFAGRQILNQAQKYWILPCLLVAGGWYGLTPEGTIKSLGWELQDEPEEESDRRVCNMVLYQATIRYPELELELPVKGQSDRTCPHCNGTGRDPYSETIENLVCYCGGLGWIPSDRKWNRYEQS